VPRHRAARAADLAPRRALPPGRRGAGAPGRRAVHRAEAGDRGAHPGAGDGARAAGRRPAAAGGGGLVAANRRIFAAAAAVAPAAASGGAIAGAQVEQVSVGDAAGLVAASCTAPQSDLWFAAGATTTGRTTVLTLANPSAVAAQVGVRVWSENGPVDAASFSE